MNRHHEKLLIATVAGLVITAAAAFMVSPAMAAGYDVDAEATVVDVKSWDHLNIRKWPASYSQKVGQLKPGAEVWVERCIVSQTGGSDWCLIERGNRRGWVNSRYLEIDDDYDI